MKLLVTGASGFLGSYLVRRFLADGHTVAAYRRRFSSLENLKDVADDVDWFAADSLDDLVVPFHRYAGFDAVIHTATSYGRHEELPDTLLAANVVFPLHLLDHAVAHDTGLFINTDTILPASLNYYALSKRQFCDWGIQVASRNALRFANIRLEHIYGPGDSEHKFTTMIIRKCLQNVPVIPLTEGEQMRDFLYIEDAVDAYALLLQHPQGIPEGFTEFGLGSGQPARIRDFAERVHQLTASSSELGFGMLPYRGGEIMQACADLQAIEALGWRCRFNLDEGLRLTIDAEIARGVC